MRAGRVERDSFGKTYRDLARGTILGNRRALSGSPPAAPPAARTPPPDPRRRSQHSLYPRPEGRAFGGMETTSARLAAMRLALAQRAGFATIEEHTAHKRAEYAAMCARIDAERAQEAAARRRLAAPAQVGFFLVSTSGTSWFTVTESERRAASSALAATCPGRRSSAACGCSAGPMAAWYGWAPPDEPPKPATLAEIRAAAAEAAAAVAITRALATHSTPSEAARIAGVQGSPAAGCGARRRPVAVEGAGRPRKAP